MNSLVVLPEELVTPRIAVIRGARERYVTARHKLKLGARVRGGVLGGRRGEVHVAAIRDGEIELAIDCELAPLSRHPVVLLCGVPRPQTVKKVIHLACTLGIEAVHFVRSACGEKSYLQSSVLTRPEIEAEIIEGLEQACDSIPPSIVIHRSWRGCLRETIAPLISAGHEAIIADTRQAPEGKFLGRGDRRGKLVAIGPEAGWSAEEVDDCVALGFSVVSLGERMLRTEVAVAVLLGRVLDTDAHLSRSPS